MKEHGGDSETTNLNLLLLPDFCGFKLEFHPLKQRQLGIELSRILNSLTASTVGFVSGDQSPQGRKHQAAAGIFVCSIRTADVFDPPRADVQRSCRVKAGQGGRMQSAVQRVRNEPPTNSRDSLLKVVSRVPSPASQEGSEGGLQPDGDASKRPPQHSATAKRF